MGVEAFFASLACAETGTYHTTLSFSVVLVCDRTTTISYSRAILKI